MKKTFSLFIILAVLLLLPACNNDKPDNIDEVKLSFLELEMNEVTKIEVVVCQDDGFNILKKEIIDKEQIEEIIFTIDNSIETQIDENNSYGWKTLIRIFINNEVEHLIIAQNKNEIKINEKAYKINIEYFDDYVCDLYDASTSPALNYKP